MPEQMTEQMEEWVGKFGEEYVDRNITSPEEFDNLLYRGNNELLWKTNFAELYLDRFPVIAQYPVVPNFISPQNSEVFI